MEQTQTAIQPIIDYDHENPPLSIFNHNLFPLLLPFGYIRCILIPLLNKDDINYDVEFVIYDICCMYCSSLYISLTLNKNNPKYIINNIDDYEFKSIVQSSNTSIICESHILRITVKNSLKMDWNSIIKNESKYGTIILTVYGDINMSKNTNIMAVNDGNIYILCNNLIMRKGSNILTSENDECIDDNSIKETHLFGNIYLNVNHSIIMDKICLIQSGNIKINCNSLKIGKNSRINALRNNLDINAKNGIECDDDDNVFKAVNNKNINNIGNEIKLDELMMASNLSRNISLFREKSEFECIICMDFEPNIMIKPCGHSSFCTKCIDELYLTQCPICRTDIHSYYDFNQNKIHQAPKKIIKPIIPQQHHEEYDDSSYDESEEYDDSDDSEDDEDEDDESSSSD